jgi:Flp pilus assembly protein TadD
MPIVRPPTILLLIGALALLGTIGVLLISSGDLFPGGAADKRDPEGQPFAQPGQRETSRRPDDPQSPSGGFVGSAGCRECHEGFYKLWSTSHHGLAMQPFTPTLATEKLRPQHNPITIGKNRYQMMLDQQPAVMRQWGPEGVKDYPILHAMGGKNVYYFLTLLERGRLQVLPLAFDVRKQAWFDAPASGVRHFPDRRDEALPWTDRLFTFNTTCFNCHVSQLRTNYDLASDSYRTEWAEPGISCESCHGLAGEHVRVMRSGVKGGDSEQIKIIRAKDFTPAQVNDMCATCHAKMVPLSLEFQPGRRFFDHYDLVTLEHPDYYPDGRDLGENYTFTSWLMSPCVRDGKLDCTHCHTPSGRMRFPEDQLNHACLPCHSQHVGNPEAHGHHPPGSKGNQCVACHMPTTQFAAMNRSDHSMRPPAPAATLAFKSPNACNICHEEEDAAWADQWLRKWYPRDYQREIIRRGELIDAARKADWRRLGEMLADLARPQECDEVYRASLVRLLRDCPQPAAHDALLAALKDPSPLVRSSAASALAGRLDRRTVEALLEALRDEYRLVRIRGVAALAALEEQELRRQSDRQAFQRAAAEFTKAMTARPDDWASHANLGNFYLERKQYQLAAESYEIAFRLEPRVAAPMVNASMAYANLKRTEDAERCLRRALRADPTNAAAHFNLGLLTAELGRTDEAEQALRRALKFDPKMAAAAYNLGVLLGRRSVREAAHWCAEAYRLAPGEPKYAHAAAFYLAKQGEAAAAAEVLRAIIDRKQADADCYFLLAEILRRSGQAKDAAAVYRQALERFHLPEQVKAELRQTIKELESTGPRG